MMKTLSPFELCHTNIEHDRQIEEGIVNVFCKTIQNNDNLMT